MSEELAQQVAELARRIEALEALGVRVGDLEIAVRTKEFRFSERMALVVTAIVGAIMVVNVIATWVHLWIN